MKCPPEIELNEFAEDRLESRRRWEIQEHLNQCDGCRTDLEGLQWVGGQLGLLDFAAEAEAMDHPSDADLAALAEGHVEADRKAELLSHLGVCAECARLFGALPRTQRKAVIPSKLYSFAAAAVVLICVGVFAFTGKFADHRPSMAPVVAQHGNGKSQTQKFAHKPLTGKVEKPLSKPVAVAAVKPVERAKPTVAVKPVVKPVTVVKPKTLAPKPVMVAQATPPVLARHALKPHTVVKSRGDGRTVSATRTRGARGERTGRRDRTNNMQLARRGPDNMARVFPQTAAAREGAAGTRDKTLRPTPSSPSPAKVLVPGAPLPTMAVVPPGAPGAAPSGAAGAPGAGAAQVTQKSQVLPDMIAQSRNDLAAKARLKQRGRTPGTGQAAGQKAKGEITKSRGVKGSLKSPAGKSAHHRSSSANAKFAQHHRTPSQSGVAHSQPTGAHAHEGPTHV